MDEGTIKYEDLIHPDDSIKQLIAQLDNLSRAYADMFVVVTKGAKTLAANLKSVNTAASEHKQTINEASIAADRLARAQYELKFAMSETGKEVAWLKSQTSMHNKMSVETRKEAEALIGSYNKLKSKMQEQIALWKSLSGAERSGAFGRQVLQDIQNFKAQLSTLDGQLRAHVQSLSEVERAEQRVAFLRSKEGQRLIELKQQIRELTSGHKSLAVGLTEVEQAAKRYQFAVSATNIELKEYDLLTREANKRATLTAQLNKAEAGSYNMLAAQYELNKMKLNAMAHEERYATNEGKALEAETLNLYRQMTRMQEAIGNHKLALGNYKIAWNGLGNAMTQIVRELPTVTMGANMFFLAISNNVPILKDEIDRLREKNKLLLAEGKEAIPIGRQLVKSIFSLNTVLVVSLTLLTVYGKQVMEFANSIIHARRQVLPMKKALDNMVKALDKHNDSYGRNITNLKKLSSEWKELATNGERIQWIKDNKTLFDQLDVSVRNVNDAENIFANNTDVVVESLKARAKAAAAMHLAAEDYEKAMILQAKAEAELQKGPSSFDKIMGSLTTSYLSSGGGNPYSQSKMYSGSSMDAYARYTSGAQAARVSGILAKAKKAEANADQYFEMADKIIKNAQDKLKEAGIEQAHKYGRDGRGRQPKDLTDIIYRNDLELRKKYEASLTALQKQEFEKRRNEATDQANQTIRTLQEKFRKNEVYLTNPDGKYKPLSDEQKKMIEQQQAEINATIENTRRKLAVDIEKIDAEEELERNKKLRSNLGGRLQIMTEEIEKERKLMLEQRERRRDDYTTKAMAIDGQELTITGNLAPEDEEEYLRDIVMINAKYDAMLLKLKKDTINSQLELVKKGSEEELKLIEELNDVELKLALAQNTLANPEEQADPEVLKQVHTKRGNLKIGETKMTNFDQLQKQAEAEFNILKRNEHYTTLFKLNAEKERWEKQIELAKQGALDWSEAQLKEAEATIAKLNREIKEEQSFIRLIGEHGTDGAILTVMGFDEDALKAWDTVKNTIIDSINEILEAEQAATESEIENFQKRVDAAQAAYDAEIEARNNGYANNVATAAAELQNEKKMLAQKQKLAENAQRKQETINAVMQASSLVTASANLWSSFSSIPYVGPALAAAAIAAMWTSYAVSKVRASQIVKSAQQQYGEGGLEFLEGGSHASGNDIDLHTTNSKGKNMRAEGGEAMAIINKRNTRKYRKILPPLIESLNNGSFEEKYARAFKAGDDLSQNFVYEQKALDLSRLEADVRAIKQSNETRIYSLNNGTVIEKHGNVTRKIHY